MDIELSGETLELLTDRYRSFEPVDLSGMFPQLDTVEKRNLAAFQIGMARQVPIPQDHPLVGHFWYPPEMAAAYHLQHSTAKIERLATFVQAVASAVPVDQIHDVGANAGLFAGFSAALVSVPIHCYEPIPLLQEYIAANAPGASLHNVALGAADDGEVSFYMNAQSLQTSSLHREAIIEDAAKVAEIKVPMRRLDRVATGRTIVKIDVQGAELQVLAGMEACIDDCQALLVESTYLSLDTVTDIIPLAREAGFEWLYVVNDVSFGADVLLTRAPVEECRQTAVTSFRLAG
ncbi:MAG: FkbM family methyltransferase [Acidimicrobiia bacterium]|nr:FkbM family methyltransferase [Acidimicrobiia bacterium]